MGFSAKPVPNTEDMVAPQTQNMDLAPLPAEAPAIRRGLAAACVSYIVTETIHI